MAEKNGVYRRKILEAKARVAMALGPGKRDWANAARPDRIGEQVQAFGLEQDCGVVDERDAEGGIWDALWGLRPRR
jgi:hypothetical protein